MLLFIFFEQNGSFQLPLPGYGSQNPRRVSMEAGPYHPSRGGITHIFSECFPMQQCMLD